MTDLNTIDRLRVYAKTSPRVEIDSTTLKHVCTLADLGLKHFDLRQREKELERQKAQLERDNAAFEQVKTYSVLCLAIGLAGAFWAVIK